MSLKGLSPSEAWFKGDLLIALWFRATNFQKTGKAVHQNGDSSHGEVGPELQIIDPDDLLSRQQNDVLVDNIKPVESNQISTLTTLERLYLVDDVVDHGLRRDGVPFLSIDGTFKAGPVAVDREREPGIIVGCAAVGFDKEAVRVIEGGSEVVKRVTEDSRRVRGEWSADNSALPLVTIGIGPQSFFVGSFVFPQNTFELVDVMFGPFYLKEWTSEIDRSSHECSRSGR